MIFTGNKNFDNLEKRNNENLLFRAQYPFDFLQRTDFYLVHRLPGYSHQVPDLCRSSTFYKNLLNNKPFFFCSISP